MSLLEKALLSAPINCIVVEVRKHFPLCRQTMHAKQIDILKQFKITLGHLLNSHILGLTLQHKHRHEKANNNIEAIFCVFDAVRSIGDL